MINNRLFPDLSLRYIISYSVFVSVSAFLIPFTLWGQINHELNKVISAVSE